MVHEGNITEISGAQIEPVDVVAGGSPCQDLSVAGKRAGLQGERSGLYMEQVRVTKEMREATNGLYPHYLIWENVPGALSSAAGADFAAVIEEAIRIVYPECPEVTVPPCGWPSNGVFDFPGGSLAYRIHDAQYWGVAQRRRRICMLTDLKGKSAPKLVFQYDTEPESEYLMGDYPKKKPAYIKWTLEKDMFGDPMWWPFEMNNTDPHYSEKPIKPMTLWDGSLEEWTDEEIKLSNVLEKGEVDKKYYLSAKACRGILTRAERRGKELPEELRIALETQAAEMDDGAEDDADD